ncbi:MAG: 3-hydroxyisobutyrate dehydrogenase-like protein [Ramlibacter sp.]|nr:3-hydroxyisobutyrate dehydrogenase-like protein [Ramlibacter sp.]
MHIAIAGTGKMGTAIARRLLALGHSVTVWNRTPARAQPLEQAGASIAATPADLLKGADAVITIVTDAAALDAVYFAAGGLLSASPSGQLFIEMSTVAPAKQQEMGRRVTEAGGRFLECPVGGSVGPAAQGKLLAFCGGDAQDVERARPVLELLCRRIEHAGGFGAGATLKLGINLPLMVYWQTLSEALSLLQPLGLDPARIVDIFADSSGGPNMLKVRGPQLAKALAGEDDGAVSVDLATMRKDLRSMLDQGAAQNYKMPLTAATLKSFDDAIAAGLKGKDCTQLPVWWLREAGKV